MANADGSIRIDTRLDTKDAVQELRRLQREAEATAKKIEAAEGKRAKTGRSLNAAKAEAKRLSALLAQQEADLEQARQQAMKKLSGGDKWRKLSPGQQDAALTREINAQLPGQIKAARSTQAELAKQEAAIQRLTQTYAEQGTELDALRQKQAQLATDAQDAEQQVLQTAETGEARVSALEGALEGLRGMVEGVAETLLHAAQGGLRAFSRGIQQLFFHTRRTGGALGYLGSRLKRILTGALLFNGISKAIRTVTSSVGAALSQNRAYARSMADLQGASATVAASFAEILAPAITRIVDLAAQALGYIARLLTLVTGKTLAASQAAAKAAGAAGKASNNLAGWDDLNVLSQDGGGGGISPNYDYTAAGNALFDSMLAAIQDGDWQGAGKLLAEKLNTLIAEWDAEGWGARLGSYIQRGVSLAFGFVSIFDPGALGAQLAAMFNWALERIDAAQLGAVLAAKFTVILGILTGFLANLDAGQLARQLSDFAVGFLDAITQAIQDADWTQIGSNIAQFFADLDYAGIAESIGGLFGAAFQAGCDLLAATFGGLWTWIEEQFNTAMQDTLDAFSADGEVTGEEIMVGVFNGIANVMLGVVQWLTDNVFQPLIDGFCEVFGIHSPADSTIPLGEYIIEGFLSGIANRAGEIKSSLVEAFKAGLNAVIDKINKFIQWVNNALSFTWDGLQIAGKEIFPAGQLSLANLPAIPRLAQGAVIPANREFLAVLGDQRSGTNVEAPLETIKQALAEVLAERGNGDITIRFDGNLAQLGRVLHPVVEREGRRRGTHMIEGGVYG